MKNSAQNFFLVKISPHIRSLSQSSPAVKRQFFPSPEENQNSDRVFNDPLCEDQFVKTKGLIHKYSSRVLVELTLECASYCRFCTRKRKVGDIKKGELTSEDVKKMVGYVKSQPEINEIVFSGGDPFMAPKLLTYSLKEFAKLPQIKILRIHTRVPVSDPKKVDPKIVSTIAKIKSKPVYLSLHFEHPDEITSSTIRIIGKLRQAGAILLCQSVFLKKVNDNYEILKELFNRLVELGVRPYYLYRCDPVVGSEHFIVPIEKEIEIMTRLRKELSGIACPTYVIDTPNGSGKIPVPLDFWEFDKKKFSDYNGKEITILS